MNTVEAEYQQQPANPVNDHQQSAAASHAEEVTCSGSERASCHESEADPSWQTEKNDNAMGMAAAAATGTMEGSLLDMRNIDQSRQSLHTGAEPEPDPLKERSALDGSNTDLTKGQRDDGTAGQSIDSSNNNGTSSAWTAAWDPTSQAYYWWNMRTYETTWENPHVQPMDKDGASPVAATASQQQQQQQQQQQEASPAAAAPQTHDSYATYYATVVPSNLVDHAYTSQAYFNKRTGKFQLASDVDRMNPERMSIENRAKRQMQYYFDVDAYTEQRNRERAAGHPHRGTKRQLSKRDVERFKKAKQEKKMKRAREWLCD